MHNIGKRRAVVVGMMLVIAALHILDIEKVLDGKWLILYPSYFSDVLIPFGVYFLLCQAEDSFAFMRPWWVKLAAAFLLPSVLETLQYFGIWALGSTFDAWDYLAYLVGVTAAALVERLLFTRLFRFWDD